MTTLLNPLPLPLLLPLLLLPLLLPSGAEARGFDIWPHPKYWGDGYDCGALRDKYAGFSCSHFANGTEIIPGYHHAATRVCAEYRVWFPSHCVFESKKCSMHSTNWKHMGMCNHPAQHRIWGAQFPTNYDQHDGGCKNDWCRKEDEDMLCTVYQYEFNSMCNLEYNWCTNLKPEGYYEIFNVRFLKENEACDEYVAGQSMFKSFFTKMLKNKEVKYSKQKHVIPKYDYYRNAHENKSPLLDDNEIRNILMRHPSPPNHLKQSG